MDILNTSEIAKNLSAVLTAVVTPVVTVYGANQARKISKAMRAGNLPRRSKASPVSDWITWVNQSFKKEAA